MLKHTCLFVEVELVVELSQVFSALGWPLGIVYVCHVTLRHDHVTRKYSAAETEQG